MELEYKLSDSAVKALFLAAQDYGAGRKVRFEISDLTPEAREAWYTMFGTSNYAKLTKFEMRGGSIYADGSADYQAPDMVQNSYAWLEQDKILQAPEFTDIEGLNFAILALFTQYHTVKMELEARAPKWRAARDAYEAKQAQEEADKARQKEAEALVQLEIDRLNHRIEVLKDTLRQLIVIATDEQLEKIGVYHPTSPEDEEEELTEAQREALEALGLDDC